MYIRWGGDLLQYGDNNNLCKDKMRKYKWGDNNMMDDEKSRMVISCQDKLAKVQCYNIVISIFIIPSFMSEKNTNNYLRKKIFSLKTKMFQGYYPV